MIDNLVVNGDSYMEVYAGGGGHNDLAQRLGITKSKSLAIGGSADSRIIRTTLKHSYLIDEPTFYVLGVGFLSRWELPVLKNQYEGTFEGRWTNPQNQDYRDQWEHNWNEKLTKQLIDLKLASDVYSIPDRLEDLMYRLLALIASLHSRGHRVLIYQQADDIYQRFLDHDNFRWFKNNPVFVDGLKWRAVPYQYENGVLPGPEVAHAAHMVPAHLRHPASGQHQALNKFLHNYIVENKILQ